MRKYISIMLTALLLVQSIAAQSVTDLSDIFDLNSLSDSEYEAFLLYADVHRNPHNDKLYSDILKRDVLDLTERELEYRQLMKAKEHRIIKAQQRNRTCLGIGLTIGIIGGLYYMIIRSLRDAF